MKKTLFIVLLLFSFSVTLLAEEGPILVEAPSNRQLKLIIDTPRNLDATAV